MVSFECYVAPKFVGKLASRQSDRILVAKFKFFRKVLGCKDLIGSEMNMHCYYTYILQHSVKFCSKAYCKACF